MSRIIHTHDVEANWNAVSNFVPYKGEIIVYDIDENNSFERIKIGDGITNIINLPFIIDAKLYDTFTIKEDGTIVADGGRID